jgi:hypothetical protein
LSFSVESDAESSFYTPFWLTKVKINTHFFESVLEKASWHLTAPQHLMIFFLLPALARRAALTATLSTPSDAAEETF